MSAIPVLIITRDRYFSLLDLLERISNWDVRPILIDNASTFGPLVDLLASPDVESVRLPFNAGHRAIWDLDLLSALRIDGRYVVSDPDSIPSDDCPEDALARLGAVLDRYPDRAKAGLGLRLDRIPERFRHRETVMAWEQPYWERELEPGVFDAPVDTTFALYQAGWNRYCIEPAVRTGFPYVADHVGWYLDPATDRLDEIHYRRHASAEVANWTLDELPEWMVDGAGHPMGPLAQR